MSPAATTVPDADFVAEAVPLLQEYAGKLQQLAEEAEQYIEEATAKAADAGPRHPGGAARRLAKSELVSRWNHIKAPAEELARQASAVVEEGRTTGLQKVQLWLRLAEFEHYLQVARDAVRQLGPIR